MKILKKIIITILVLVALGATFVGVLKYRHQARIEAEPIEGIDLNNNGVRDDLEKLISQITESEKLAAAFTQLAISLQNIVLVADDEAKSQANFKSYLNAVDCIYSMDRTERFADKAVRIIYKQFLNNEARKEAQVKYSAHVETVEMAPTPFEDRHKGCNFDPNSFAN